MVCCVQSDLEASNSEVEAKTQQAQGLDKALRDRNGALTAAQEQIIQLQQVQKHSPIHFQSSNSSLEAHMPASQSSTLHLRCTALAFRHPACRMHPNVIAKSALRGSCVAACLW